MTGSDGTTGATKGDLIVLGDYNADGRFDGRDLDALARGASLADTNTGTQLTGASGATFGDQVRHGVLRKNAALDYLNANATTQQRAADAAIAGHPKPRFTRRMPIAMGVIDLKDAKLVDYYVGSDYRNINHVLRAVQGADGDSPLYTHSTTMKPISLVDIEMTDDGMIKSQDFRPVRLALGAALKDGDTDFNGVINFDDYVRTDNGFNNQHQPGFNVSWSNGDFDSNGQVQFRRLRADRLRVQQPAGDVGASPEVGCIGGQAGQFELLDDPALQKVAQHVAQFGDAYVNGFLNAAVPEARDAGPGRHDRRRGAIGRRRRAESDSSRWGMRRCICSPGKWGEDAPCPRSLRSGTWCPDGGRGIIGTRPDPLILNAHRPRPFPLRSDGVGRPFLCAPWSDPPARNDKPPKTFSTTRKRPIKRTDEL
jgi:hypothetical protein